jgi:hypothetical protein
MHPHETEFKPDQLSWNSTLHDLNSSERSLHKLNLSWNADCFFTRLFNRTVASPSLRVSGHREFIGLTTQTKQGWKVADYKTSRTNLDFTFGLKIFRIVEQHLPVTVTVQSEAWVLAGWLLGSWVRMPLKAWMFVRVFLCCVVLCR